MSQIPIGGTAGQVGTGHVELVQEPANTVSSGKIITRSLERCTGSVGGKGDPDSRTRWSGCVIRSCRGDGRGPRQVFRGVIVGCEASGMARAEC